MKFKMKNKKIELIKQGTRRKYRQLSSDQFGKKGRTFLHDIFLNYPKPSLFIKAIYVKYISKAIVFVSIAWMLYGSYIILITKKPAFEVLSVLGGFIGGIATLTAVTISYKEYLIFKSYSGSEQYREFIIKVIRPIPDEIFKDFMKLKFYTHHKGYEQKTIPVEEKPEIRKTLFELEGKYKKIESEIQSGYYDLAFKNKWLASKIEGDLNDLIEYLYHFRLASMNVQYYLFNGEPLDYENNFISDIYLETNSIADYITNDTQYRLIRGLVMQIDHTDLF